jgi:hypothetical protein
VIAPVIYLDDYRGARRALAAKLVRIDAALARCEERLSVLRGRLASPLSATERHFVIEELDELVSEVEALAKCRIAHFRKESAS